MRHGRLSLLVAILAVLIGCNSHAPATAKDAKSAPVAKTGEAEKPAFDFEATLKREAAPLPITKISDGILSAEVEASSPPKFNNEQGSIHVAIPIGTQSTIDCYVYDEQKDPASTMSQIVEAVKKSLEIRLFAPTDAFVAGDHGAFLAHAIYLADNKGAKAAGQLKLAFYHHPLVSALCMHDEVGYSATFKRITKRFFETSRRSDREYRGTPSSWEVSIVKLDGRPVGFDDSTSYEHPATHLTTSVSFSSSLFPRSAINCIAEDSVTTRTIDAAGELLESTHVKASGGEIELKVDLKRLSPAHYAYSGTLSGKPISGKFQTADKLGLTTEARTAANVKRLLLTGKATSFKAEEYSPSIDPTAAMETLYEIESKEQRRVKSSFGPIHLSAIVDSEGYPDKVTGNIATAVLTIERLGAGRKR